MSHDAFATMARQLLDADEGELRPHEKKVLEKVLKRLAISRYIENDYREQATFGQRIADRVAEIGGSWTFIIGFFVFILVWISINTFILLERAYDPYPFILLNLLLSCIAAIQAPIIMMSQKRQETNDRLRSFNDYRVNLKAELEVRHLHEKLDYLISRQWTRLAEMQQMQLDAMHELTGAKKPKRAPRRRRTVRSEAGQ